MAKKYLDYDGLRYLWTKIEAKTESATKETVFITLKSNQGEAINTTMLMVLLIHMNILITL